MNEAVIINAAAGLLTAAVPYLAPTAAAVAGKVINGFWTSSLPMGEKNPCADGSRINMVCLADHPKTTG